MKTDWNAVNNLLQGDGANFQVRAGGDVLPIYWKCFSRDCHLKFKPSLLGLVRGVLSAQEGKDVHPAVAVKYLRRFLGNPDVDLAFRPRERPAPPPSSST